MKYDVKAVVFDYIQSTPKLTRNMQDGYGHELREDEVLAGLSRRLKFLAEKYDIFVMSSTQLNGKSKDDSLYNSRDANAIRGSRAVVDKVDYGIIVARPTPSDLKALQKSVKKIGFNDEPNYATFVFKNRAGLDHIIIWSKNNLGNMNDEVLFITDYNYNLVEDIKGIEAVVSYDDEYEEEIEETIDF